MNACPTLPVAPVTRIRCTSAITRNYERGLWPWMSGAGPYQPGLVGEDHGLDAVAEVELSQDPFQVGLDRRLLDEQVGGDLGIGQAARDEFQHVALAWGEQPQAAAGRGIRLGL